MNYARGCNYAIFSVRFFLLFLQKWQEILYCYEIFIIYPDISLVHLKKKKLRYYLNLNMHAVCNHDLHVLSEPKTGYDIRPQSFLGSF